MTQNLYSSGSKGIITYDDYSAWPTVTKVFNTLAFRQPRSNYSQITEGIDQRAQGYPGAGVRYSDRGMPQLTWFDGTYQVPAHLDKNPGLCKYPSLVGPDKNGKRMCLAPGTKLSPEEEALKKKQQEASDKSYSETVASQGPLPEYIGPRVSGLGAVDAGTQYETALRDKLSSSYRTTEYALIGVFLAGAFLIWRS